jgi:hypothetical protein
MFSVGKSWSDSNLFNGEYYRQIIDLKDKRIIDRFSNGGSLLGISTEQAYWNEEMKEIKYQIGEGCGIDQVIAQWHANICGLGEIFDREQTIRALKSIYKYNFKKSFRNVLNPCRIYALNDEAGAIICEWPEGKAKPAVPAPYAEECWSGCEYQAAAHMIQEGMIKEGIEIVEAVRDRYDGEKRNPWNEFECGSHYARAMSSYTLLHAFSGFEFDMVNCMIGFNPVLYNNLRACKYFWSIDPAWGIFYTDRHKAEIKVFGGCLKIKLLHLPFIDCNLIKSIQTDDIRREFEIINGVISLTETVNIEENHSLAILMGKTL